MSQDKLEARSFVEGIGGRLAESKSPSYAKAVLAVEARNNEYIARHMLAGDLAMVLTAWELGITPERDARKLVACLVDLIPRAEELARTQSIGDIVVSRELWVVEQVGREAGAWLHVGRNRAESLRGSLPRLFYRDVLHRQRAALLKLVEALVARAEPTLTSLAPFYHHLQHAGRTSLGEYLLSFAAAFAKHFERIDQTDARLDLAPPPNTGRDIVVELINRTGLRLGFSRVGKIWQELFITEDHIAEPACVMTQIAVGLARLAEDLRLFMTSEFAFFELADAHASGSSGRPQKKNPFGLQAVINGAAVGAARLAGQFATNITVSEEADSTYHAYHLFQFCEDVVAWTEFMADVVAQGRFDLDELARKSSMGFAGAREALDILVYEHNVPYRYAHRVCGEIVRFASTRADIASLEELAASKLADYPDIDAASLVRTITGEATDNIHLNVGAFESVREELRRLIEDRTAGAPENPVTAAADRLLAEGRALLGEDGAGR